MEALHEEFLRDEKTLYFATVGNPALAREFGAARVRSTPISESGFVGASVGLAGSGFRPVVDIGMATFGFVAMDQMVNQAAKITYMFGGQASFPIVFRMSVGSGLSMAAQHAISPYPMYMNTPGLKIILPSTPRDVKGLLKTAIRDNNPVVFFEHSGLSQMEGDVPDGEYTIPLGCAEVKREGTDVTVVALAQMVHLSLMVAEEMKKEGISCEVVDPRSLIPLDRDAIRASVSKTGRMVVVDEACATCGTASEIVALVVEDRPTYSRLKAPPRRLCGADAPIPFSPPLEAAIAPDKEKLVRAIRDVMEA